MTKTKKTNSVETFANVRELDITELMVCLSPPNEKEPSLPTLNHGREDARSWANPWATVPTDLVHGWNLHAGAIVAIPIEDLQTLEFTNYAQDYKQTLIDNVSHLIPETGLGFYTDTTESEKGATDVRITVTRAEMVDYLRGLAFTPKYVAISAQRRTMAGPITQLVRRKMGLPAYKVPVIVKHFDTLADLTASQIADNRDNTKRDYSPAGLLANYLFMIDRNPMETQRSLQLQAGVKTGQGQKLHALAMIERQLELGLVERFRLPVENDKTGKPIYVIGGPIPFSCIDKECARGLAGLVGADALPSVLKEIFGENWKPGQRATRAQCEAYFARAMAGATRSAALDKTALTKWLNNAKPSERKRPALVAQIVRAIIAGNVEALNAGPSLDEQATQEDLDAQTLTQ